MPRKASPPRLWKRPERRDKAGKITHAATWIILDGGRQISTGCGTDDVRGADEKFAEYLNNKHVADARKGSKPDHQIPVADVLTIYARDVLPEHSQPRGAAKSLKRLGTFFRNHYLSEHQWRSLPRIRAQAYEPNDCVGRSALFASSGELSPERGLPHVTHQGLDAGRSSRSRAMGNTPGGRCTDPSGVAQKE